MRNMKTKKEGAAVHVGVLRVEGDGRRQVCRRHGRVLVSVLNNELTVIDVPELAGRELESREWERERRVCCPRRGRRSGW